MSSIPRPSTVIGFLFCENKTGEAEETGARSTARETLRSLVPLSLSVELFTALFFGGVADHIDRSMSSYAIFVVGNKASGEVVYRVGGGLIAEGSGRQLAWGGK